MRHYPIVAEVRWNLRSTTYFLTGSQEAPVLWLELGHKCCHFFGIMQTLSRVAFLYPFNVVEHKHEHDPFIDIL